VAAVATAAWAIAVAKLADTPAFAAVAAAVNAVSEVAAPPAAAAAATTAVVLPNLRAAIAAAQATAALMMMMMMMLMTMSYNVFAASKGSGHLKSSTQQIINAQCLPVMNRTVIAANRRNALLKANQGRPKQTMVVMVVAMIWNVDIKEDSNEQDQHPPKFTGHMLQQESIFLS
jgi:hypothetical protein